MPYKLCLKEIENQHSTTHTHCRAVGRGCRETFLVKYPKSLSLKIVFHAERPDYFTASNV